MCLLLLPPSYLLQLLGLRPSVRSISGIYTCSLPLLNELSCSEVVSSYLRFYMVSEQEQEKMGSL